MTPDAARPATADDDARRLYVALVRLVRALRPIESTVSPAATSALTSLAAHPDGVRIGELAERERITAPTATRMVAVLEKDGLVERHPDPSDGRAWLVRLSADGWTAAEAGRGARVQELGRRLRNLDHTPDELRAAVALLEQLGGQR